MLDVCREQGCVDLLIPGIIFCGETSAEPETNRDLDVLVVAEFT